MVGPGACMKMGKETDNVVSWCGIYKYGMKLYISLLFFRHAIKLSFDPFLRLENILRQVSQLFYNLCRRESRVCKNWLMCAFEMFGVCVWGKEAPQGGSVVKNLPAVQEMWVQFLGWENPLEEEMATHSSIGAWVIIPWTEDPSGLYSPWGCKGLDMTEWACTHCEGNSLVCHLTTHVLEGRFLALSPDLLKQRKTQEPGVWQIPGCFCCMLKLSQTNFGQRGHFPLWAVLVRRWPSSTCPTSDCSGFVNDWMRRQQIQKVMIEPRRALLFHFILLRPELTPLSGFSFSSSLPHLREHWQMPSMVTSCPKR